VASSGRAQTGMHLCVGEEKVTTSLLLSPCCHGGPSTGLADDSVPLIEWLVAYECHL
jgi:hypothetical protein